jgi:hypothetical protein
MWHIVVYRYGGLSVLLGLLTKTLYHNAPLFSNVGLEGVGVRRIAISKFLFSLSRRAKLAQRRPGVGGGPGVRPTSRGCSIVVS